MWELDYKESWALKNWYFWTVVLEKTLESPLDYKEIQPVNPKGNQSWIFIGRTDAEAETPILWPPDVKSWLIGKDPDAGKDWRQDEKGTAEDEMVGWYHRLKGHELEQTPGDSEGQGSLACCSPWGRKEWGMTEELKNIKCGDMEVHYMIISTWHMLEIFITKRKNIRKKACPMWDEVGLTVVGCHDIFTDWVEPGQAQTANTICLLCHKGLQIIIAELWYYL